jgi:DNA-directed RNA polymerase subunit alpha
MQHSKNFVSFVESRVENDNYLYARFHLGTFVTGQALTVANALRRSLLADIPSWVITGVEIEGINHEFSTLPGVQENVLNIILNLKRIVLANSMGNSHYNSLSMKFNASINFSGPGIITAGDIKFPPQITAVFPDHHIATINSIGSIKSNLIIEYIDPTFQNSDDFNKRFKTKPSSELLINYSPKPIRQINFGIHKLSTSKNHEYISIEILSDGSIHPKEALDFSLKKLTKLFYNFTQLSEKSISPIF